MLPNRVSAQMKPIVTMASAQLVAGMCGHSNRRRRQQATDSDELDKAEADDHDEVRPQAVEHDAPPASALPAVASDWPQPPVWLLTQLQNETL